MHFHEIFQFLHPILTTVLVLIFTSILSTTREAFSHQVYTYLLECLNTNEENFLTGYEILFRLLPNLIQRFILEPAALRMIAVEFRFDKTFKTASPSGKIGMLIIETCKAVGLKLMYGFQRPIKHDKLVLIKEIDVSVINPLPSKKMDTSVNEPREFNDVY